MNRFATVLRLGFIVAFAVACSPAAPPAAPTSPAPKEAAATKAAPPPTAKPLEKVSLRLDWLVVGYHAPFFIAQDKGWYRDAGLDVTIGDSKGSVQAIQLVASGTDTFAYATGSAMIAAIPQGAPVMMVAGISPKGPEAVMVHDDSPIKTLKDLEGKTFGASPTSTVTKLLPALLKANGVDPSKVQIVAVDFTAKTPSWLERKFDSTSTLINDEAVTLDTKGVKYRLFVYGDYGVNTFAHGIVVNTKTIQEKPAVVKGFVEATLKGWKYAFEHPEEAAQILTKMAPDAKVPEAVTVGQLKATLKLSRTANTEGKPLGWMSEKDWQQTVDLLAEYGDLKTKPPVNQLFTNQFIPNG